MRKESFESHFARLYHHKMSLFQCFIHMNEGKKMKNEKIDYLLEFKLGLFLIESVLIGI